MVSQYFARKCIDENYFIHLVISEIKKIRKSRGLKLINNMQRYYNAKSGRTSQLQNN